MVQSPLGYSSTHSLKRLPSWFKQDIPPINRIAEMKDLLSRSSLSTVCESAHCPNMGKCWGQKTATFMILGEVCTRACRFCAVKSGRPSCVDADEPQNMARAVQALNLRYVVITSVTRDDLVDGGAGHFAATIEQIRTVMPQTKIEILIPDFSGKEESLMTVLKARPEGIGHNLETVRRLSAQVRPQADYQRSLEVLKKIKQIAPRLAVKSGFMVGLGETDAEIFEMMQDLAEAGCDILTIGQYLSPSSSKRHLTVERFVAPKMFQEYKRAALDMGIKQVMSAPLVRSSYLAEESYVRVSGFGDRDSMCSSQPPKPDPRSPNPETRNHAN